MIPDNRLFLTLICKNDNLFRGWKHFWFLSLPSRFEIYLLGFDEFFHREKSSRLQLVDEVSWRNVITKEPAKNDWNGHKVHSHELRIYRTQLIAHRYIYLTFSPMTIFWEKRWIHSEIYWHSDETGTVTKKKRRIKACQKTPAIQVSPILNSLGVSFHSEIYWPLLR